MTLNIGIISAAGIAEKNIEALTEASLRLAALASRSLDKAAKFVEKNGFVAVREGGAARALAQGEKHVAVYGNYDDLINDQAIDAVYIPLPSALHLEVAVSAAKKGKHILCEKPTANTLDELGTIIKACDENNVVFMDGVMFMHNERTPVLEERSLELGAPRVVSSAFSFCGNNAFFDGDIRMKANLEPFGSLGDLGWYCIRGSMLAFGWKAPRKVQCTAIKTFKHPSLPDEPPKDAPASHHSLSIVELVGQLYFDDGVAMFHASFNHGFRQWLEIAGPQGRIYLDDFVLSASDKASPYTMVTKAGLSAKHRQVVEERSNVEVSMNAAQETSMWRRFAQLVKEPAQAGDKDAFTTRDFWKKLSLRTQAVLDACQESALGRDGASVDVRDVDALVV